jgi:hypothetical protein
MAEIDGPAQPSLRGAHEKRLPDATRCLPSAYSSSQRRDAIPQRLQIGRCRGSIFVAERERCSARDRRRGGTRGRQ